MWKVWKSCRGKRQPLFSQPDWEEVKLSCWRDCRAKRRVVVSSILHATFHFWRTFKRCSPHRSFACEVGRGSSVHDSVITRYWPDAALMLGRRLRRWPNIKSARPLNVSQLHKSSSWTKNALTGDATLRPPAVLLDCFDWFTRWRCPSSQDSTHQVSLLSFILNFHWPLYIRQVATLMSWL